MYYLETIQPSIGRTVRRLPVTRDQSMLLLAAVNEIFLGIDVYLAHKVSGTIVPNEWIPIIFGPIAGLMLLVAGLIALRARPLASLIATATLAVSVIVGLLGAYFHLIRATLPNAPIGERVSVYLLIWAPPILGPLTFALVGWLGVSAAWIEDPPGSGNLVLPGGQILHLPFSKTRAYFFMVGLGTLATVISSVLDHARTQFENPWLWIPTLIGVFGTVVPITVAAIEKPSRGDMITYAVAMLLLLLTGPIGTFLHIQDNLTTEGTLVMERFIRGAPFLAPLLFSNMGLLGLLTLLDPRERA